MVLAMKTLPQEGLDLLEAIDFLPSRVGCKPFAKGDDWMIVDIAKFIIEEYPKLLAQEVLKAFTLAATRKLLDEKNRPVSVDTFGNYLSIKVVGAVLTAYQRNVKAFSRAPKFHHVKNSIEEVVRNSITKKESYEMLIEYCDRDDKKIPNFFALWRGACEHLIETGELIQEVIDMYIKEAEDEFGKKKKEGFLPLRARFSADGELSTARERAVREYLKSIGYK
jgi:hypothetical protein